LIILDTNVVSEPTKPHANAAVVNWLDVQAKETLYLATPVLAELLVGLEALPVGRRKDHLGSTLENVIDRLFAGRILSFDEAAARRFGRLMEHARGKGHVISLGDGQIAAIASVHGFTVATRDVVPFLAAGVPVLNPWQE
jgi:hypothetical protein